MSISFLWLCFRSRLREFQLGAALITKITNIQVKVFKNPILQEWDWTSLICKQQQFEDHQSDCLFYLCLNTRLKKIRPIIIDDCQPIIIDDCPVTQKSERENRTIWRSELHPPESHLGFRCAGAWACRRWCLPCRLVERSALTRITGYIAVAQILAEWINFTTCEFPRVVVWRLLQELLHIQGLRSCTSLKGWWVCTSVKGWWDAESRTLDWVHDWADTKITLDWINLKWQGVF